MCHRTSYQLSGRHLRFCNLSSLTSSLLITLLMLTVVGTAVAQFEPECLGGRSYVVAFPDTVRNLQDTRFLPPYRQDFIIYMYSPVDQEVRVSHASNDAGLRLKMTAGQLYEFDTRDLIVPIITQANAPQLNTLRIEADYTIVLYAYFSTHFGAGAYTPLPVEGWGTDYFVAAWPGGEVRDITSTGEFDYDATQSVAAPAEILIIAAHNNTMVTIENTGNLAACNNCQNVVLKAGEAYLVQSSVDISKKENEQEDIAGTRIRSSKPIGVISGNTRTEVEGQNIAMLAGNSSKEIAVEWISPVSRQGTEFVFTPTMDDFRYGINATPQREAEFVQLYGTQATPTTFQATPGLTFQQSVGQSGISRIRISKASRAHVFTSNQSAMAFQSPKSTVMFNGIVNAGSAVPGGFYKSWGTYMVEMVPREKWRNFAPFIAPHRLEGMQHYVNVVSDTAHYREVYIQIGDASVKTFPFNQGQIGESDLIWGSLPIVPGVPYKLLGREGATFTGFVYGTWSGFEKWTPGGNEKGDAKGTIEAALHPSEYEEAIAQAYAYPLPSFSCTEIPADSYEVKIDTGDCGVMTIEISTTNLSPAGFEFISLNDSAVNTELEHIMPASPSQIEGESKATIIIRPNNPANVATGTVSYRDRSPLGTIQTITYHYDPEYLVPEILTLDFGSLDPTDGSVDREITFLNPHTYPVNVSLIGIRGDSAGFSIVRTEPMTNWANPFDVLTIPAGDSVVVTIRLTASNRTVSQDTLYLKYDCFESLITLNGVIGTPCLQISDIDFGKILVGQEITKELEICNVGVGTITFHDSSSSGGGAFISWISTYFTIDPVELAKLQTTSLAAGECVKIPVQFVAREEVGEFRTIARIWANTLKCETESEWRAVVVDSISSIGNEGGVRGLELRVVSTTDDRLHITFTNRSRMQARLLLFDATGREIDELFNGTSDAPQQTVNRNATDLPSGLYFVRLITGEGEVTRPVYVVR